MVGEREGEARIGVVIGDQEGSSWMCKSTGGALRATATVRVMQRRRISRSMVETGCDLRCINGRMRMDG